MQAIQLCDQKGWSLAAPLLDLIKGLPSTGEGSLGGGQLVGRGAFPGSLDLWRQVSTFAFLENIVLSMLVPLPLRSCIVLPLH